MKTTAFIMLILMLVVGFTDAVLLWFGGIDYTISRWMQLTMYHSPLFTFMCGGLFGHFMCKITAPIKEIDLK